MNKQFQSQYDPTRENVGKIYRDLHLDPSTTPIEVGDMTNAMLPGFVEDLNQGIQKKPFGDTPWFIMIHEKKDLQMRDAILRRVLHFKKRPWPEDDTIVFWHHPVKQETRFCWCLPHWSEMTNIMMSKDLFDPELVTQVKAWRAYDLYHFGFTKDDLGNWIPDPRHKDKPLKTA